MSLHAIRANGAAIHKMREAERAADLLRFHGYAVRGEEERNGQSYIRPARLGIARAELFDWIPATRTAVRQWIAPA